MSERPTFRVGDVVRVYGTPGPRMIVSKIIEKDGGILVRCFWFNRKNEFAGQDFGPSFLCKEPADAD